MGRSKFPGKPPKTASRKRIKVLGQPEATQNDPVTVAENIYYGLSLFNETFGDNEKEHPPFHGFSTKEANLSASYIKTQRHNAEKTTDKSPSATVENLAPRSKDATDVKNSPPVVENGAEKLTDANSKPVEDIAEAIVNLDAKRTPKIHRAKSRKSCKKIKFSNYLKNPVLKSVNNILDQHQRTRQLRNSTAKRLLQRAKTNGSNARNLLVQSGEKPSTVRKFVLPVRSVHSSRVIKPNKRFIEELEEISGTEHSENEIGTHVKKARLNLDKFVNRESKLKSDTAKLCTKLKDREIRSKTRKVLQGVNAETTLRQARNTEKSANSVQNAQISKTVHREVKKSHTVSCKNNKVSNSVSSNCNNGQECPQNTSRLAQAAKSTVLRNQKQISIPTKVLPDSNVPNFESSRVQTRSGTQNEVASDSNNQASFEGGAGSAEDGCAKTAGQVENNNKTVVSALDSFEAESNLSESESESEHRNHSGSEQSEFRGMKLNGGKVILRKARLKLDNKCLAGTEGPFSTSSASNAMGGSTNLGLTGTIKCGVCGAVRFYRFVKQARKFGIHSCESCRKFISKMIKRQACAKSSNNVLPILQCHKGDGLCLVPPVVRSQQWNLMRCVYKARCPACWLKMCLKCYNIPPALRTGLNALLPPLMRDPLSISMPLSQDEDGQGLQQKLTTCTPLGWPAEDSTERNLFKSAMSWRDFEIGQKTSYQGTGGFLYTKIDKFDSSASISPNKKRKKNNRIKVRKKIGIPTVASPVDNQCPQPLRQRLELKGPRVKHVCRSASVALGQPIATFPTADTKEDNEHGKNIPKTVKETERTDKRDELPKEKDTHKSPDENNLNLNVNATQQSHPRRGKPQQSVSTSHFSAMSKTVADSLYTVSIDFWEQYEPSEVGAKGFALIGSELFHVPAICYLCGSAGKEPLIHCQCCCEPYHAFCLEPSEWNACAQPNWSCPRCTICQSCHLRSGPKLSCIRCRQSFHHSCLSKSGVSSRLYSPDRPYVCQSCIKCKSCGSEGVSVYVGNLPLCSMCFKLRQQGNYCPLCQRCYNENDFDTKMMECSECSCWVHARCEGLSDERYQILSYLPDSIEYTCSQCSSNSNSVWRNAIEAELKAGFIGVIKSLSKNRKICTALKWSPRKECLCRPVPSARRPEFSEDRGETNHARENEESEESNGDKFTDADSSVGHRDGVVSKPESEEHSTDGSSRKGLRRLRQKFHLKDCSVRVKNCVPKDSLGFERKDWTNEESISSDAAECHCSEQQVIARPSPTLMSVKRKVNGNEYKSLSQFHCDMEHVIIRAGSKDLMETYHEILQEVFPWFTPKNFKSSEDNEDTLTTPNDTCKDTCLKIKLDDFVLETWKEEVMRAPKAIAAKMANLYNIHVEDSRSCCLCKGLGDGQEMKEGRLLYCGQNEWVHANCALWSNEVFEEIDGSLQNVHSAISRGRLIRCTECGKKGASIGCCAKNCSNTFHFPCARNVGLTFNDDKRVFCGSHSNTYAHKPLQNEQEFSLKRPVYVELDRKKKKYVEPNKVKMMIGSLMIDCLGTIVPEFSDTPEKIIPCDYKCSRLYWSTVNPYKVVKYCIRTYVQVHLPEVSSEVENNITIDHTKEQEKEKVSTDAQRVDYLAVKQTLDTLVDIVCNKEVDENLAEQNNTDLLPPELKEAIFEDLPHDLLDGISMQDIFPKMSYEDFLAMDLKNDASFTTDLFKDDMLPSEIEETIKSPDSKISKVDSSLLELGTHNDLWVRLEAKTAVQDLMDDLFNSKSQKRGGRELKRSKSEVMSNNPLIVGGQRHHQRSCSLTWSCKLDNTYGPSIKRRKLPRNPSSTKSNETGLIVLDAQNERTSMFHELRIPESIMVTVGRANTSNILSDSVRELKYCIEDSAGLNRRTLPARDDAKEHKRLFWHPRQQQPRIVQVDGPADANSASECSSPEYNIEEKSIANLSASESLSIPQLDGINDEHSSDANESSAEKDLCLYTRTSNFLRPKRIFSFIRSQAANNGDKSQRAKSGNGNLAIVPSTRCALHKVGALLKEKSLKLNLDIPQVDGAGDISSDDECVTSQHHVVTRDRVIHATYESPFEHIDRPVTCKRCCCTYRTQDSYNRHLANCDIMITSDSDSETMDNKLASPDSRFSPSVGSVSPQFITLSPSEGHTLSTDYTDIQATSPIEASVPSPHPSIQIEPIAQAIITPQIHTAHATVETVHQTVLTSNDMIVQTQYTRRTTTLPNPAVLPPQESTVQITEITDPPSVSSDSNVTTHSMMSSPDSTSSQTVPSPEISPNYLTTGVQTAHEAVQQANAQISRVAAVAAKSKTPRVTKSKAKSVKSQHHVVKNVVQTPHNVAAHTRFQPATMQGSTAPVIQLQQTTQRPTVILQQVASPGIVSAYVETLQQQSGQNLQYITAIGGGQHEAGFKPQFIATNPLMPGTYIQAPSDNLLALQNGGISILPSVQIAQTQPTVLGTIIQQQPGAIQCGVISSEQLLLSSTPTLEMFADPTGGMFVSNQPMYYGLETIVSNTVMSSSQFMAGAVPQVLASSYQTTTQVFQASKLMEPIVDVQTVPGVPTVTAVQAVQNVPGIPSVQNMPAVPNLTGVSNVASVQGVSSMPNVPAVAGSYVVVNQSAPPPPPTPATAPAPTAVAAPTATPVPASISALIPAPAPTTASAPIAVPSAASMPALPMPVSALTSASVPVPTPTSASASASASVLPAPPPLPPSPASSLPLPSVEPIASSQMNISVTPQEQVFGSVTCNVSPASCTRITEQLVPSIQVADVCPSNIHAVTSNGEATATKLSPLSPPPHAMPTIPRVAVRPSPVTHSIANHGTAWRITEPLFGTDQPINNSVRPYFDSKHVSENTSMIKSSISSSKIPPLSNHYVAQRNLIVHSKPSPDVNSVHKSYNGNITPSSNCANASINSSNQIVVTCSNNITQNKISMPTSNSMPTSRPMNRVLPMQAVTPKQDPAKTVPKDDLTIEEPTKPVIKPAEPEIAQPKKTVAEEIAPIKRPTDVTLSSISDGITLNTDTIEKVKENLKLELDKEKLQNTSLKIVLQKQLQDGSYKITRNMKTITQNKKAPQVTSVEILPAKQVPQIASLQLLPIKTFTLKTNKIEDKLKPADAKVNLLKTKTPPVAVKKPRIVAKSIKSMRNNPSHNSQQTQKNCAKGPTLMYEIKSQDGFTHTATSMTEVWETVYQAVQNARKAHNLPPLPHNSLSEGLGLENNATIYLIEQLSGVNRCTKYKTRFHTPAPPKLGEIENELPAVCASGAARAEPFKGRKALDMFGWLASQHRLKISETESRRAANPNFPTAMRFRTLKGASKGSLGVYHSHIHGRGLFCLRDIEAGEMVIEYAGEVIRSSLTDKREKYYDSKNIGCYMFKIDDHLVVDATMKGNAARFINHSCEPNCYSRVVDIVGKKHILIFALRRIIQGEELTYDYKFPFEDIKIPCTCGSRRCRKYLN